jgi:hypothetical protein
MLVLKKRHGSKFWTARGSYLGVKVDRSTGACDKGEAQAILAKIQNEIFERARGRIPEKAGPTFAEAVILYCKKGGERRFLEPLLKYYGDLPISKIDQQAIEPTGLYANQRRPEIRWYQNPIAAVQESGRCYPLA